MSETKSMTVLELRDQLTRIIDERPHMASARMLIDTEARRFDVHMVEIKRLWDESDEVLEAAGMGDFVVLVPDYSATED